MTYRFVDRIPTLDEHQSLSELVGWRSASVGGHVGLASWERAAVLLLRVTTAPSSESRASLPPVQGVWRQSRIPGVVNDLAGWLNYQRSRPTPA
jgi:hypothetical protein